VSAVLVGCSVLTQRVKFSKRAHFSVHAIFKKKASGQLLFLGSNVFRPTDNQLMNEQKVTANMACTVVIPVFFVMGNAL